MSAENAVTIPAAAPSTSTPSPTPSSSASTSSGPAASSTPAADSSTPASAPAPKKSPAERALEAFRAANAASKPAEDKPAEAKPAEQAKTEDKPAAPTVEERLAQLDKGFRNLNKREAELRSENEKLKAERAELEEYKKAKARAKLDPTAWMKAGGLEFDQVVTAAAQKDGKPPNLEVLELQETVNQLKQKLDDDAKKSEQAKQEAQQKAGRDFVASYRGELANVAKGNAEKYDLVSAHGEAAIDLALQVADEWATQHKRVPKHDEMLDIVEQYLYDEQEKLHASSKKLKSKFSAPQGDQPQVTSGKAAPASPKKPPTLNNGLQGNAPAREAVNPRKLTGAERVKWALESTRRS